MEYVYLRNLLACIAVVLLLRGPLRADEKDVVRRVEALFGEIHRDDKQPGQPIVGIHVYSIDTTDADAKAIATQTQLTRLFLCRGNLTPAVMKDLEKLRHLKKLAVSTPPLTNDTMKSVAKLSKLEELAIWGVQLFNKGTEEVLTDEGIKALAPLKHLRVLDLNTPGTNEVVGTGLKALPHLRESLQELALGSATAAGLEAIAEMKNLRKFELGISPPFGETECKLLARLTKLRSLSLRFVNMTDRGWRHLESLENLEELELRDAEIGAVGLEHIQRLPKLKTLHLHCREIDVASSKRFVLPPRLQTFEIHFGRSKVSAESVEPLIQQIARAKHLRHVAIHDVVIKGQHLKHLAGNKSLRTLELNGINDNLLVAANEAGVLRLLPCVRGRMLKKYEYERPTRDEDVLSVDLTHFDEKIQRVGDLGVKQLIRFKNLQGLFLQSSAITDAGLKELAHFPKLQSLQLQGSRVTLAGVKEMGRLKNLKLLSLRHTDITDAGLSELQGLTNLEWVTLVDTKVSPRGIESLVNMPRLNIELDTNQFTDDMLRALNKTGLLKRLTGHPVGQMWGIHTGSLIGGFEPADGVMKRLELSEAPLTDRGVRELAILTELTFLDLSHTAAGDAGMKALAPLKELKHLNVSWTKISDTGIDHLARLKNLVELHLTGTNVSDAALMRLESRLPKLQIKR